MTKKNQTAEKQSEPNPQNKVWRIARFKERYEYRDDKDKKGVLQYTRDFVSAGADTESRHFIDQLAELKEFKNWRTHEGSFVELKRRSADDVYGYRGYLLHKHQPADLARIARWLDCSAAECKETLDVLAQVGLIELVDVPDFTAKASPQPQQIEQPAGPLPAGNPGSSAEIPGEPGKIPLKEKQTKSEIKKNLKEKRTGNPKPEEQSKISQSEQAPQAAAGGKAESNEPETRNPNEKQTAGQQAGNAGTGQSDAEPDDPDNPTLSDAPAGASPQQGQSPQDSANRRLEDSVAIRQATEEFGIKIFTALFHRPPDLEGTSKQSSTDKSEVGCFAVAMSQARTLNPQMFVNLYDRSLAEAVALGNEQGRRKKARNKAAVWRSLFGKFLNAARAGELRTKKGFG